MIDIQTSLETRGIPLESAGICDLTCPIEFEDGEGEVFSGLGKLSMSVAVGPSERGTHMSRFIEVLSDAGWRISVDGCGSLLLDLKERLGATDAAFECRLKISLDRLAPVSRKKAPVVYEIAIGASIGSNDSWQAVVSSLVPVKTLCPCSKAISQFGAHNQRGYVSIRTISIPTKTIGFRELIAIAEKAGSSGLYTTLKRVDEKWVTEAAYENPVFVEDVARNVYGLLRKKPSVIAFQVKVVNHESIHTHNAFSVATYRWRDIALEANSTMGQLHE